MRSKRKGGFKPVSRGRARIRIRKGLAPFLSILGGQRAVRLSREYWEAGCLFFNFSDEEWRKLTDDTFPKTLSPDRTTHPLYVLEANELAEVVCPCSSKNFRGSGTRYIPKGATLEYTGAITDRNIYILEFLRAPLAPEETCDGDPLYCGSYEYNKLELV